MSRARRVRAKSFVLKEFFVRVGKGRALRQNLPTAETSTETPNSPTPKPFSLGVGNLEFGVDARERDYCACSGWRGGIALGGGVNARLTFATVRPTASDA